MKGIFQMLHFLAKKIFSFLGHKLIQNKYLIFVML